MGRGDETNKGDTSIREDESIAGRLFHTTSMARDGADRGRIFRTYLRLRAQKPLSGFCSRPVLGGGTAVEQPGRERRSAARRRSLEQRRPSPALWGEGISRSNFSSTFSPTYRRGGCDFLVKPCELCGRSCSFLLCNTPEGPTSCLTMAFVMMPFCALWLYVPDKAPSLTSRNLGTFHLYGDEVKRRCAVMCSMLHSCVFSLLLAR